MTEPVPTHVGITVTRLDEPGAVRLVFSDPENQSGYMIDLDPAAALQVTLMMVNAVAVGSDVFTLEQAL